MYRAWLQSQTQKPHQDRGFIWDPVADQIDSGGCAHGGDLDQGLFHRQITRRLPLTQEMNSQHRRQWIGRKTFLARRGRVGLDQATQRLPEHHFHLIQELLSLGPLLGRSELVIGEAKLVTAHQSRLCIRLQAIIPRKAVVLQSPPRARLDYPSPWRGAAFMTVRSLSAS